MARLFLVTQRDIFINGRLQGMNVYTELKTLRYVTQEKVEGRQE